MVLRERGAGRGKDTALAELAVDLVIDASGRPSHISEWLEGLGIGRPVQERVESGIGYVTRVYRDGSDGELTDTRAVCELARRRQRANVGLGTSLASRGGFRP